MCIVGFYNFRNSLEYFPETIRIFLGKMLKVYLSQAGNKIFELSSLFKFCMNFAFLQRLNFLSFIIPKSFGPTWCPAKANQNSEIQVPKGSRLREVFGVMLLRS
jgi:hypothetical protein